MSSRPIRPGSSPPPESGHDSGSVDVPAAPKSGKFPSSGTMRASSTILLVDDEAQVRVLLTRILKKARYRVLAAKDAAEALALYEQHGGRVDLLLTDVKLPEMDGRELAERVHDKQPDLKVLFVSSFHVEVGDRAGAWAFLPKPITPDALRAAVDRLLLGAWRAARARRRHGEGQGTSG